jgi:hypothetical protein
LVAVPLVVVPWIFHDLIPQPQPVTVGDRFFEPEKLCLTDIPLFPAEPADNPDEVLSHGVRGRMIRTI